MLQAIPKSVYKTVGDVLQGQINSISPKSKTPKQENENQSLAQSYLGDLMGILDNVDIAKNVNPAMNSINELSKQIVNSNVSQEQKNETIKELNKMKASIQGRVNMMDEYAARNPYPQNIATNTAVGIAGMLPDIAAASLGGRGATGEALAGRVAGAIDGKVPEIVQKLAPKAAALLERSVKAPFTKVIAAKGAAEGAANDKENPLLGGVIGATKGTGEGMYMHVLGEAAGKVSPFISKVIGKTGASSEISTAIANPLANAGVFTLGKAVRTPLEEGRMATQEELEHEMAMGIGFSLLHAGQTFKTHQEANHFYENTLKTDPQESLGRILNEKPENILRDYNPELNVKDLTEARNELKDAIIKEPDLAVKKQLGEEALKIQNQLDAKEAVEGIVKDKDALVEMVDKLPELNPQQKEEYVTKIEQIAKDYDPIEVEKGELNNRIKESERFIKQSQELIKNSTEPSEIIKAEADIAFFEDAAAKDTKKLKDLITKPKETKPVEQVKTTDEQITPKEIETPLETVKTPEKDEVKTPDGFQNRIHEGGIVLGEPNEKSHITDKNYTYRSLGQGEIDAIKETGGVFSREGKQKGGNKNVKYWSRGNGKFFYKEGQNVIRVKNDNIKEGEVVKADNLEIWDKEKNKFVPFNEVKPIENEATKTTETAPKTEETSTKTGEESVKGKENVTTPKEPIVEGKTKADAEVIQPAKDDGGGNEPKAERVGTADEKVKPLDRLAHQNIESEDLNNTASNQAREKGREFTDEERQYNVQKKMDALRHGDDIVVEAKTAFGDEYVSGLLKYIDDNGKTLTADKKQLMYVTLENDLNRQLLADPENLTLKKQEKLVADKSRAFGRETGRAVAMGQLRQLARVGYDASQVAEDFFSPKERTERSKVEKAVQATPDDINKEYETREESRIDAEIEKAIESGVQERIDEIYEALPSNRKQRADKAISALERIQKKLRSRTYDASIGVPIAVIDAGITTIKQAIKTGVKVADAIELGIAKIKEKYGKAWKNEDKFRKDMLDGFSEEKIDIEDGSSNTKTDPTVKQALIDAGYSREMTIKNKEGVKEKREILDWKKLTGEEGSLDNINKVIDQTLGDKGYTSEEIANIKQALKDEYNDLHASIIEKATNELERRNTPRDNNSKILARRLAELYNYGLFEKESDTYDRLINQTLGVSIKDQAMFDEIKGLHKSLADLVDSRDASGKKLSDVALSTAEAKIKNDIKKVIQKVAYSSGNGAYKATVIIKNLVNGMQRQLLNTVGQLVENPISASYNDMQIKVQDAFKKGQWDTPELKAQRRMLSKAAYKSVLVDRGEEYGGVGSPFTTKNAFDDAIRSVAPSKLYQAYVSAVTGTAFLDSSDSAFKIKRTELEFTHNLIRVLTDKSNPNGAMSQQEALQFVSESLTGQSFADAKKTAKEIIESVNTKAGKEILSPSDTNVIRMANDIVKDALVKGERITKDLVEDSFKAAYTTAGTGLGHESNNIITKGLGALNRSVETELNDAIKRKEFNKAAMLNMASILTKNVLNPFAGGGANWTIIGMQKMGVPVQYFDPRTYESKRLDLSTVEGLKDTQRALTAKANLQRSNGRTLIAGTTGLIIAAAVYGSKEDDEIRKWRKKHPQLDKYLNKVIPPALALLTNPDQSTKGKVKAVASIIGDRSGGYGDKERLYAIGKDLATNKNKQAAGRTGDLVGSRFSVPYSPIGSSQMSYQVRDLYREFQGLPPIKSKFKNKDGFVKGFFKRGWFDFLGGNDKDKKE